MIFNYTQPLIFIKVLITHVLLLVSVSLYAQRETAIAKEYLRANAKTWGLTANDLQEMKVSSAYLSPSTGWFHIYFNQYYQSIPVYNSVLNVTVKDEQVIHVNNSFVSNTNSSSLNNLKGTSLTPKTALQKVAAHLNLTASESSKVKEVSASQLLNGSTNKVILLDRQLSTDSIRVSLCWLPTKNTQNKKNKTILTLVWNVVLTPKDKRNVWSVHLDANSGAILHQTDAIIHCDFGKPSHSDNASSVETIHKPSFINTLVSNSYHVFDLPIESPNHGSRTLVTQPYTRFSPLGTGPSTTNGWHHDGINSYTITRGNNVWVQEDTNGNDGIGASPSSSMLSFDYPYSQGLNTATSNLNAAMTNVFYWNNVIHDILWKYGFDEPSGNFQQTNLNRGGLGNDFIFADVQDGEGTNNANFQTSIDGYNGRMQMYLWKDAGNPSYQPDGDFDNGIVTHEYAHGWSTRLTGGPANSSCLENAEQGGEGWSDYLALMLTTNWASLTPSLASANIPRAIGTYVLGQSNTGSGIRPYPYSYDKVGVNNEVTYAKVGDTNNFSIPHGVGSIWATILWDMTWEIILQDKKIIHDIYDTSELVGNIAALKLVNEGLRLQPCSPSFIDSRDAILKADLLLFNGRYQCAIGRAFSRRGVGQNASTGNSSDDRSVIEDFTPISANNLTSARNLNICSNSTFTYQINTATPATTLSWSRPITEGLNNAASSGTTALIEERLTNITTSPVTATYHITQSSDACNIVQDIQVTVYPQPIPSVNPYSICQNSIIPNGQGLDILPLTDYIVKDSLTNSSPSYARGIGDANTTYIPSDFNDGTAVHFKTFSFTATKTGPITIEVTSAGFYDSDSYLSLYKDTFAPTSPAINFLVGDDDSGINYLSSIQTTLTKGEKYILVVSTYYNQEVGDFTLKASIPIFNVQPNWYKTATETTPLFTGTPFNPLTVAASGISNTASIDTSAFYVATPAIEGCRSKVQFVVFRPFLTSSSSDTLLCYNNTTALSATCSIGVPQWNNQMGVNSNSVSVPPIVADTSYQVHCEHLSCKGQTKSIRITLRNPVPAVPKDTLVLQGEQLILQTSNCTSNGNTLTWYRYYDTPITFPQQALNDTSFYYARCTHSNCLNSTLSPKILVRTTNVFESVKTGDWEKSSTWNVGLIPRKTHKVIIHTPHSIILNTTGYASRLDCNGQLLLNSPNSKLELSP